MNNRTPTGDKPTLILFERNFISTNLATSTNPSYLMMTDTMLLCKTYVEQMYQTLESNIISMVFAKKNDDDEKLKQCEIAECEMINAIMDASALEFECFMTLLIAEYKERVYWSICDAHYEQIDCDILCEFSRIFAENSFWDILAKGWVHNPNNVMFTGKYYHFYNMLECKGGNILTMSEAEVLRLL